ncbi:nuclease homologue [Roseovarius lutimaris]|uniref:Nuclease homologue n=1 Tax=Roseovarius lutimaris TaxID=1005928 RepID=A0A1I5DUL0_9RHOB|nr:thermonuclease family protein [Roseovarius lutimaris]SFO02944.1 nuclease homologue [Roseovarius lutimaris]
MVDGDTIRIGKVSLRLAGIDAPELEHPWGKKAKWELVSLCKGQIITAEIEPELSYDRLVATCFLPDGRDLSAEMVRMGMALDWPKFSGGKYKHLEPEGVRKKHWKAAARQRGHMQVFHK